MQLLKFKTSQILAILKTQQYFIRPFTQNSVNHQLQKKKRINLQQFSTKCLESLNIF